MFYYFFSLRRSILSGIVTYFKRVIVKSSVPFSFLLADNVILRTLQLLNLIIIGFGFSESARRSSL